MGQDGSAEAGTLWGELRNGGPSIVLVSCEAEQTPVLQAAEQVARRLERRVHAVSYLAHPAALFRLPHDRDRPPLREREVTSFSGVIERLRSQRDPTEHDASERVDHDLVCFFHAIHRSNMSDSLQAMIAWG